VLDVGLIGVLELAPDTGERQHGRSQGSHSHWKGRMYYATCGSELLLVLMALTILDGIKSSSQLEDFRVRGGRTRLFRVF